MLFTRCPDCRTTFRITNEALHKADGQVRCGRCSNIFNAYANLRERLEGGPDDSGTYSAAAAPAPATSADPDAAAPTPRTGHASAAQRAPDSNAGTAAADGIEPSEPAEQAARAQATELEESAQAAEHAAPGAPRPDDDPASPPAADGDAISADEVDAVLATSARSPAIAMSAWMLDAGEETSPQRARVWRAAAAVATLALVVQIVHYLRAELVTFAAIGPAVQGIYSSLGAPVVPRWDVEQYEVIEWVAAAEPNARGQGNLVITARIHNRGPLAQPYPHVQLQLLDRWEGSVGRRVFRPHEYLVAAFQADSLMQAGDTAEAQLVVVDPGPDAYGFALDVCVETQTQLNCATDQVFR